MKHRSQGDEVLSKSFYTHPQGYKLQLQVDFYEKAVGVGLNILKGEFDKGLQWPIEMKVNLQLLNQAYDVGDVTRTKWIRWIRPMTSRDISNRLIKYSTLEKRELHLLDDCLVFKITVEVLKPLY